MNRKKLIWKLYPSYLILALICVIVVVLYAIQRADHFYSDSVKEGLKARARLLVPEMRGLIAAKDFGAIQKVCQDRGRNAARITIILPDGKVVGDSEEDPANMENHANRPEIKRAYGGAPGDSVRPSPTLKIDMVYATVPVKQADQVIGVVRMAITLSSLSKDIALISGQIAIGGAIAAAAAILICLIIARYIARPLEDVKDGAIRFARGDLGHRLPPSDCEEINAVVDAMNTMAEELSDKLVKVKEQGKEVDAILASMIEGVLAVDGDERIISINDAVAGIFQLVPKDVVGHPMQEVLRNPTLQDIIHRALHSTEHVEGDIVIYGPKERFLQAHATLLGDEEGQRRGVVVVLNDVTRLRKLENVRRDFVANVSHELKTPITSIKGFVETLQDGAKSIPEDRDRFLGIVIKQVNRLNAIIEDLLLLSRLEQEESRWPREGDMDVTSLKSVLVDAVEVCKPKADDKSVAIEMSCRDEVKTVQNGPLLEQAVVNLVDNAVKYSEKGKTVTVTGKVLDDHLVISVQDEGCGIEEQHLPRLFERFYRVDKARSRQLGGTGLGLAIVKHIAQTMKGTVSVESRFGQGSLFAITIPLAGENVGQPQPETMPEADTGTKQEGASPSDEDLPA